MTKLRIPKSIILPFLPDDIEPKTKEYLEAMQKIIVRFYDDVQREIHDHEDRIIVLEP